MIESEKESVIRLIKDYQDHVENALAALKRNAKAGYVDLTSDDGRSGMFFDPYPYSSLRYKMHGIGCLFKINETIVIDIDYAAPRYDGIDFWFLAAYLKSNPEKYPKIYNRDHLMKVLEELLQDGWLVKVKDMYYVKSLLGKARIFDWHN